MAQRHADALADSHHLQAQSAVFMPRSAMSYMAQPRPYWSKPRNAGIRKTEFEWVSAG